MTLRAPRRIAALLAAPAFVAAGVAAAAPGADAASTTEPTYQGSALAVSAKVGIAGSTILDEVLPGLITYPPGATKSLLELPAELSQLVSLKVLNASSEVKDGKLVSNASTANLGVLGDVIGAKVITADCLSDAGQNSGDSQVAGLTIAGTKVPVDPGPNVRIELPDALAAFVKGSIVIDEQVKTADGGLQVTALHINLVVAPTALDDALNSVIASVREAAQQVKVVLEEVTGKTLDQLIGKVDKSAGDKKTARTPKKGAQDADRAEVRASAAAPAAPQAATETEAATEAAAPAAEAEQAAPVQKTDGAAVEETTVAEESTAAEDTTATEDAAATEDATAAEDTDAAAAAERAERSEKGAKAAQPAAETSTDPAVAPAPAEAAPVAAPAAPADVKPADSKSEAKNEKAGKKAGSDLAAIDTVRKAVPSAADIAGAVGVDIVISQVTCDGEPGKEVAKVNQLPGTGGNGDATRDVAIAGLGLLAAGGAAVYVTRRRGRGRHAAI